MAKVITIYFSMKGETIAPGMKIVNLEKGNTAVAAEYIRKAVGGELFEIKTVKTYIKDHFEMIEEARKELQLGTRVEITGIPEDFDEYDTVYLGYPNWWNRLPMPVVTFLEKCNWNGKTIIPFCTNEGSGLGKTVEDVKTYAKGANLSDGFAVIGSQVRNSEPTIAEWARKSFK